MTEQEKAWAEFDRQLSLTTEVLRGHIRTGKRRIGWKRSKRQRQQEAIKSQEPGIPTQ